MKTRATLIRWKDAEKVMEILAVSLIKGLESALRSDIQNKEVAKHQDTWSKQDVEESENWWGTETVSAKSLYNSGAFVCAMLSIAGCGSQAIQAIDQNLLVKGVSKPKYGPVLTRKIVKRRQLKRGPKTKKSQSPKRLQD